MYPGIVHCSYVTLSSLFTFVYISKFHTANEDEFGGLQEILKEGFMTAFATFLVRLVDLVFCVQELDMLTRLDVGEIENATWSLAAIGSGGFDFPVVDLV